MARRSTRAEADCPANPQRSRGASRATRHVMSAACTAAPQRFETWSFLFVMTLSIIASKNRDFFVDTYRSVEFLI
jgi:hypothetical protein